MIEAQIQYVAEALRTMRERNLSSVEVRREVVEAYDADIQRRLQGSVWNSGGCASWYLDDQGRNSVIWPGFTWPYKQRMLRFDPQAYVLRTRRPAAAPVTA
jgi:hypothetical protein